MVWMAASYLTASPMPGSSSPMCVCAVLHAASAADAIATIQMRLEDMAVVLLESDGFLGIRHAAADRRYGRGWRGRRIDRHDEGPRSRRHARVGTAIEQQV